MAKHTGDEFLTVKEVAEAKGVPTNTIYRAISRGTLAATEKYGATVIRRADAEAYTPQRRQRPTQSKGQEEKGTGEA